MRCVVRADWHRTAAGTAQSSKPSRARDIVAGVKAEAVGPGALLPSASLGLLDHLDLGVARAPRIVLTRALLGRLLRLAEVSLAGGTGCQARRVHLQVAQGRCGIVRERFAIVRPPPALYGDREGERAAPTRWPGRSRPHNRWCHRGAPRPATRPQWQMSSSGNSSAARSSSSM